MPTGGQLGTGIKVAYATGSPHTWLSVTQLREVEPPQFERDRVDATVHGVTGLRQYIPGLSDVTDVRLLLEADLDSATTPSHSALRNLERSQVLTWFRVEIPVSSNLATTLYMAYVFQARVAKWGLQTPIDGLKEIEVMLQFGGTDVAIHEPAASQIT